jgi:putative endonuclease
MRDTTSAVYIMTNRSHRVFYTGVTPDLVRRVHEHRAALDPQCFTARYRAFKLVYYEAHPTLLSAIPREKQIKGWTRAKKVALIGTMNPRWDDLWSVIAS